MRHLGDRRLLRGLSRRKYSNVVELPQLLRKEDAACCLARRDELGRPPIGFCGPDCLRRPGGDAA